jgi:peptidoglycan glycosyltransferase
MNAPIVRLFSLVVVLFALLVAFTSRWTVFEAEALRDNRANRRQILAEQQIRRGTIRSADRRVLARAVRAPGETYARRWPTGPLFAHAVGYSFIDLGRAGLERSRNEALTGRAEELVTVLESILGDDREGNDLVTTLDAGAQEAAVRALGDRRGAVVALDVDTGGVRVMTSSPSFDPNGLNEGETFERLATDEANAALLNRATQSGYPPGSTMKVVTAAAALDSGRFQPGSIVDGNNGKRISGVPLNNFGQRDWGAIDLTTALTNSVNTVWAEVGVKLGGQTMDEYMRRFGFYAEPELDYPPDQMVPSGVFEGRRLVPMTADRVDVGRVAIGQERLRVTALQMAMVAQTIANGGERMKPRLVERVVDRDGRVIERVEPEAAERVVSGNTARALTGMMRNVVAEGTGTAAALEGVQVAGKTGTAEIDTNGLNQPWFVGFTGDVAVAVTVERVQGGQGGTVAAPIAKQVLEALGA